MWVDVARIVRGQAISLKEAPFVIAEKSMGVGHIAIMLRHILPNIIGPILVIAVANFATAILVEAGLSYIGFGINPPNPSLGNILNEHYGYAVTGKIGLALIPAVTIMVLILSFNLVGLGLRDAFDVKD
jgi:peptide/nickel transport system permease protein